MFPEKTPLLDPRSGIPIRAEEKRITQINSQSKLTIRQDAKIGKFDTKTKF
jgi:hypothetical protein